MQQYWTRWETWMQTYAPRLISLLYPGVSADSIAALEDLTGAALPATFKAFYAIHDGQKADKAGLVNGDTLLPLHEIILQWQQWKRLLDEGTFKTQLVCEPDTGICYNWWNPLWIPFTHDGLGNYLCIDLDPTPGGTPGQVITFWHDDPHREIVAPSFEAWISDYINAIERGEYIYLKKWGIVHKDAAFNYNDR
ncbi:SMI1/KNR4 family protein [Chitinophaga vietnamensis]|uniref:SMI1/KNR4 family protein n=1 Tax=Chitinophaga vietnamensis TaxID=2593957 RepID=UPI001177F479|nr:SMI1/KNR4 family protein [Chitinophaga vietnamensis]